MKLTIFNVFHQRLFPELLRFVPEAERGDVVQYGVNEAIPKELPATDGSDPNFAGFPILLEYKLPKYFPWLQERGYCQTSGMYHVYKNELDADLDYIGWSQYDMQYRWNTLSHIRETIAGAASKGQTPVFYELAQPMSQALSFGKTNWNFVLDSYNAYFGTSWTLPAILAHPRVSTFCPLVHTFVIPREMFRRMMGWMCDYLDSIQAPGAYPSIVSQAEFAERIHGLFLGLELAREEVTTVKMLLKHEWPSYHNQCPFAGYKTLV